MPAPMAFNAGDEERCRPEHGDSRQGARSAGCARAVVLPGGLYINPEIVTDADGRAASRFRCDSITTWRMAMMASRCMALGSGTSSLKSSRTFSLTSICVTLTQATRLDSGAPTILGSARHISLKLQTDDWFRLVDDVARRNCRSNRPCGGRSSPWKRSASQVQTDAAASMKGAGHRVREIEVIPNGREQTECSTAVGEYVQHKLSFPQRRLRTRVRFWCGVSVR